MIGYCVWLVELVLRVLSQMLKVCFKVYEITQSWYPAFLFHRHVVHSAGFAIFYCHYVLL